MSQNPNNSPTPSYGEFLIGLRKKLIDGGFTSNEAFEISMLTAGRVLSPGSITISESGDPA